MMKHKILLSFALLLLSCGAMAQIRWATFHGCEKRCGIFPVSEHPNFGEISWKFKTGGKIFSSPAVWGTTAFIGSEDKNLYAIDTQTGQLKWSFTTGGPVHASPTYFKNRVYFGSFDGYYYALNATTGKEIWRFKTGGEKFMGGVGYLGLEPRDQYLNDPWDFFLSSPAIDMDEKEPAIYFGSSDGHVYAVYAKSGKLKWKYKTGGMVHASPALFDGKLYVGSWDGVLYALDQHTGRELWKYYTGNQVGMKGIQASPTVDGGKVYFGARDAHLYALDAQTGKLVWKYFADNSWIISTAAAKDGNLYVGTSDTYLLLALDAGTGKEKWRFKTNGYVYGSPALVGTTAFFGDFTGKLYALDLLSEGKTWVELETESRRLHAGQVLNEQGNMDFNQLAVGKDMKQHANLVSVMEQLYGLGSIVSSPAIGEGVLYFGSTDGYLYAVKLKGEKIAKTTEHEHSH